MLQFNWSLVYNIINLIVLCLLLKHFLIGPVLGIMDKRQAMIAEGLKSARDTQAEADELKGQYEAALKNARQESGRLMDEAKARAQKEYDRILADASAEAAEHLERSRASLEQDKERAMEELKSQVADLALLAARKAGGQEQAGQAALSSYDRFLEEAGDNHDKGGR